jgi:putative peptide zinc metalloprotease protein
LRRRNDLVVVPQTLAGKTAWAVKDPMTLRYFHLSDEEYCVFESLDGAASLESVQEQFERRFAPRRLSLGQLHSFLGLLHQEGLILVETRGQTAELLDRAKVLRRNKSLSVLSNLLAIRFPGIDPQPLLDWLLPKCRWLFARWTLAAGLALVGSGLAAAIGNFGLIRARFSELSVLPDPATLFWLAVSLAVTKVLHELGHALACRHFGGECHEMGFMLLVFTPCLYCNVSDAWMLGSKWRRAAIGSAGVCVELVLAALGTFVWLYSEPGLVNTLAFNVMLVSSIGTVLFNGNPLMRYDGYFVLSDLVEIPNLAQQASTVARDELAALAFGIPPRRDDEHSSRVRLFLALYAVASLVYRAAILLGIFWFVHRMLKAQHLEPLAIALGSLVLVGLVAAPLVRGVQFLQNAYWSRQMQPRRALAFAAVTAAFVSAALFVPLPHRVAAPAVLEVENARRVYALVGGTLDEGLALGSSVAAGERIARLENLELDLEIARLRGERDRQKLHVQTLRHRESRDNEAAAQVPVAEEALADLEERLARRLFNRERLTINAPAVGTVLPGRRKPEAAQAPELEGWSGLPLEPINRGCYLEAGTLLCLIGDPDRLEASLVLDQSDVEFIQQGQAVEIRLDQDPTTSISGTVRDVSEIDLKITPPELVPEGAIPTRPDERGLMRPAGTVYQARVSLDGPHHKLLIGQAGQAKVHAGSLSIARRLSRYLSRTFRFEW